MGAVTAFEPTGTLQDIVPRMRRDFEDLLAFADGMGLEPRIRSAGRTCAEQYRLLGYGPATTKAAGCRSAHVVGHAVDLVITPATCTNYTELGEWWEDRGGTWGGRWTSFGPCGDLAHFHMFDPPSGATPKGICPKGMTLEQCETAREVYLDREFNRGNRVLAVASGVAVVAAVSAGVWLWTRFSS